MCDNSNTDSNKVLMVYAILSTLSTLLLSMRHIKNIKSKFCTCEQAVDTPAEVNNGSTFMDFIRKYTPRKTNPVINQPSPELPV